MIYLVLQTPHSSYIFWGPLYRENGQKSKKDPSFKLFLIHSYPLAKNVISSSLKVIYSLKLIKHFKNGSPLSFEDTPKTAFLVTLVQNWNLMVGQGHIFEPKLE